MANVSIVLIDPIAIIASTLVLMYKMYGNCKPGIKWPNNYYMFYMKKAKNVGKIGGSHDWLNSYYMLRQL